MLPTSVGTTSSTSLLGPSLLDGNSRDSFVSRSLADVAEVCAWLMLFVLQWGARESGLWSSDVSYTSILDCNTCGSFLAYSIFKE